MGNEENNEVGVDQQGANTNTGENQNNESQNDNKSGSGEKTFTQTQVNGMMAKEKQQGRKSVLKELGIKADDEATIAMVKAFVNAQKTPEQKNEEQANENSAKVAEAEKRARIAEAKVAALGLGANADNVDDIVTLALAKADDTSDVNKVISEFKKKYSFWFEDTGNAGGNSGNENNVGNTGTGSSLGGKGKSGVLTAGSFKGIGKTLAESRATTTTKNSYWSK